MNIMRSVSVDTADRELVRRALAGDDGARQALFERHREAAYRVAFRVTGRNEDALDVVQDSFIRAFAGLAEFRGADHPLASDSPPASSAVEGTAPSHGAVASFRTWLLRIVSNRALDLVRSRRVRRASPLDGEQDGESNIVGSRPGAPGAEVTETASRRLEQAELAQRLERAIAALSPEHRAVFSLYASGEMTYAEIADAMKIPVGTVMSRLYHARRRLAALLPGLAPGAVEH